ncbi:MAG: phosphatase PAP2 family protein [Sphaerobacteraceae bacterium]|nr:MAG: phosphatase PAP2 family protein [Sphaerobacteraceae bacterium]
MNNTGTRDQRNQYSAGYLARRGVLEITIVVGLFMAYFTTRGLVSGRSADAFHNAHQLMQLQNWMGISWELSFQSLILQHDWLIWAANSIYVYTHMPALILFALWVFIWHHDRYPDVRNIFLGMLAAGLITYTLIPMAPPRFFTSSGFVDTLAAYSPVDYHQNSIEMLYNPYAAMPSLHVGFAVFVGIGVIAIGRQRRHWILGTIFPILMSLAVVGTGNHFVLDVVAGAALAFTTWFLVPRLVTSIREWRSHSGETAQPKQVEYS